MVEVDASPRGVDGGPKPCHWYEDEHGGRYLIPGCMGRAVDPDIEVCSCESIEVQLAAAREEIEKLKRSAAGLKRWHDHVVGAVYEHRDGVAIMKRAADRSGV